MKVTMKKEEEKLRCLLPRFDKQKNFHLNVFSSYSEIESVEKSIFVHK